MTGIRTGTTMCGLWKTVTSVIAFFVALTTASFENPNTFHQSPQLVKLLTNGVDPELEMCPYCAAEPCVACNDVCFKNKTEACADCWAVNKTTNFACLSDETSGKNVTSCTSIGCWLLNPCDVCDAGSCHRCKACQSNKEGSCASCWKPDSIGYSCLSDNKSDIDCRGCWNPTAPPIVIPPGLTASTISATWEGVPGCEDQKEQKDLWPIEPDEVSSLKRLACYIELMKIKLNNSTREFEETPGVKSSTVNWGGLDGLSFGYLVRGLYAPFGWRDGINMFGIPFDWRYSSRGKVMESYYSDVKKLVEDVYEKNGQQRVSIMAPSYGPQIMLGFLHRMAQSWKNKYIAWFTASSPVWSGSPLVLLTLTNGVPLPTVTQQANNDLLSQARDMGSIVTRQLALNLPVTYWMTPRAGGSDDLYSYARNYPLVITPSRNYSAWDVTRLLEDMGHPELVPILSYLQQEIDLHSFEAPLVDTYVNYATGIDTPEVMVFARDFVKSPLAFPDSLTKVINASEMGDGIVPKRSSLRGKIWTAAQNAVGKMLVHKDYPGLPHGWCMFPVDFAMPCFKELANLIKNNSLPF